MEMPDVPLTMAPEWLLKLEAPKGQRKRKPNPPPPPPTEGSVQSQPPAPAEGSGAPESPPPADANAAPQPPPPPVSPPGPAEEDGAVREGGRHNFLLCIAGKMRQCGMSGEAILAALRVENVNRCRPPMPEDEVEYLAQDVADRYDPDPLATVHVRLPPAPASNGHTTATDGQASAASSPPPEQQAEKEVELLPVRPISELERVAPERKWLLEGYLARGRISMLSALFKAGKTTLLAHLLKAIEADGRFIGQVVKPCKVLVITEEHEDEWAERRDVLGLKDHIDVLVRPAMYKMTMGEWMVFLNRLNATQARNRYDLIVIDPISNFWPVRDENNAAEVQAALMPLHGVLGDAAMLLLHHLRKAEGQEGTQSRGSGAIAAFIDLLLEMRRFAPKDLTDRRRVLTGTGRWRETPVEVVISLGADGYSVHGDKADVRADELAELIFSVLPTEPPGKTDKELLEEWPEEEAAPKRSSYLAALRKGVEKGHWQSTGRGVKGDPFKYFKPAS
jgi:hypothetical protein